MKELLSINNSVFEDLRNDIDNIINRTIGNMQQRETDSADITIKLSVKLEQASIADREAGNGCVKTIQKPKFGYAITSAMQIKDKESDALKGEYQLVWNEEEGRYELAPIDDGQMSMFDDELFTERTVNNDNAKDVIEEQDLIGGEVKMLGNGDSFDNFDDYDKDEEDEV